MQDDTSDDISSDDEENKNEESGSILESMDVFGKTDKEDEIVQLDPLEALNLENQSLLAEISGLKDRLLRSIAEMENLRKRTEREVNEARSFAIAGFARDMLGATDNLNRALMVVPKEKRDNADETLKSLIDGIEMTEREMQRLMQKNGIMPVLAMGEKFDPHKHQAMFEVPNTGKPDGTIVEVVQMGYAIGSRILRPAMVGIAKNIGKPAFEEKDINHVDKQA